MFITEFRRIGYIRLLFRIVRICGLLQSVAVLCVFVFWMEGFIVCCFLAFCVQETPAVRSRLNCSPNRSQLERGGLIQEQTGAHCNTMHLAGVNSSMGSHTVDIKIAFPQYDCVPGPACREFQRNLLQLGAKTDDRGYTLADCFLRQDEGAAAQGTDLPGVPHVLAATAAGPLPAAGALASKARIARQKRLKDSAAFLVQHISDATVKQLLAQPQFSQNGPEMFDHIMSSCLIALTGSELHELRAKVLGLTMKHDVGFSENSVLDLIKTARVNNLLLAPA